MASDHFVTEQANDRDLAVIVVLVNPITLNGVLEHVKERSAVAEE